MDIICQGRAGQRIPTEPSPSKLEQRLENPLRSFMRKLMLFGLLVVVAKAAIATRVLIARAVRNDSAFGNHLGHQRKR